LHIFHILYYKFIINENKNNKEYDNNKFVMNNNNNKIIKKETLTSKYHIIKNIGSGSFSEVYLVSGRNNNKLMAMKVEDKCKNPRIMHEYSIYKHINNNVDRNNKNNIDGNNITTEITGIPKIYGCYNLPDYNIMTMELLGDNLEELFNKCNRIFTITTVLNIGIQIVKLLKFIHDLDYIHRDIKPNNFLIGKKNKSIIYIMDFGLAKKYRNNKSHIPFKNGRSFVGTARYASINMHFGIEPSRRDDLESVGYMLIYFLKNKLPWEGLKKSGNIRHIDLIGEKKMSISLSELCKNIPKCFEDYLIYCKNLKFAENPNYDYLINLLNNNNNNNNNNKYDWIDRIN
jgi:serine/threonine protein kinase